jgi:hypothetical protein
MSLGHFNRLFVVLTTLLLDPALALAEADGPDFYRLVDVVVDDYSIYVPVRASITRS